ncbi:CD302 antigen-like [Mixophyes fleayi]|uniref:CD302 antigen-like n=1 Tax=Mixophyes fleayi TaxID=3061075 RepID=UPI003F4DD33D
MHSCLLDIGTDISINTQEENAFLLKMFQTQWKGPKEILLGMFYDSDDDSLKWFDKSEVTFSNWRPGQIANENLNTCVKRNMLSGLWDITDCDNFAESAVLCKTLYIPKKNRQNDQKAIMITLITAFTVIVLAVPIVLLVLHKRNMLPYGFTSRHLQGAAQIRPYSDDAILVDTMEREDYA